MAGTQGPRHRKISSSGRKLWLQKVGEADPVQHFGPDAVEHGEAHVGTIPGRSGPKITCPALRIRTLMLPAISQISFLRIQADAESIM